MSLRFVVPRIASSEITSESAYRKRRGFIRAAGLAAVLAILALLQRSWRRSGCSAPISCSPDDSGVINCAGGKLSFPEGDFCSLVSSTGSPLSVPIFTRI
jgi:hypothetical protein